MEDRISRNEDLQCKIYTSKLNPWELRHHYLYDGTIIRTWRTQFLWEDGLPQSSEMRCFKRDGSMKLDDLVFDIEKCFQFTGLTDEHREDEELHKVIYETKLPKGTVIMTSAPIDTQPATYYDLFKIMGVSSTKYVREYLIWEYPSGLEFEAKDNKLFFGYCH